MADEKAAPMPATEQVAKLVERTNARERQAINRSSAGALAAWRAQQAALEAPEV